MLYQIELKGLRAFGYHGVAEFERQYGQEFIIDAALWLDAREAAATDDVSKTAHYGLLADALVANVKTEPVNLIETLVTRLVKLVLGFDQQIQRAQVTVHKPNAPIDHAFQDVSVTLMMDRADG